MFMFKTVWSLHAILLEIEDGQWCDINIILDSKWEVCNVILGSQYCVYTMLL